MPAGTRSDATMSCVADQEEEEEDGKDGVRRDETASSSGSSIAARTAIVAGTVMANSSINNTCRRRNDCTLLLSAAPAAANKLDHEQDGNKNKRQRLDSLQLTAATIDMNNDNDDDNAAINEDTAVGSFQVPTLLLVVSGDGDKKCSNVPNDQEAAIAETYQTFQLLHIPCPRERSKKGNKQAKNDLVSQQHTLKDKSNNDKKSTLIASWKDIGPLFQSLAQTDQDSWCVENTGCSSSDSKNVSPFDFLQAKWQESTIGYSSFLVQTQVAPDSLEQRLPVRTLSKSWRHGPCVWFFFGVHHPCEDEEEGDQAALPLEGRPEHIDSVSHDGTWHYQLSGCKRWHLRPTQQLLDQCPRVTASTSTVFTVDCQEGDVIVVNTRLWWHRTTIPRQPTPSVSYARDFYHAKPTPSGSPLQDDKEAQQQQKQPQEHMSNVDGLYAANDIEQNTIIFMEKDMPDCELHTSTTNPNCKVVELEDGTGAVVSIRPIGAGEFFCVPEEQDEDDEQDDEQDDEETLVAEGA